MITNHFALLLLYTNIDQTLMNSFHGLLNFEMGILDCRVITTKVYFSHSIMAWTPPFKMDCIKKGN